MEKYLDAIKGMEVVDTKDLAHGGFAILFDSGIILTVTQGDHLTWSSGPGFIETWDMIEEGS